MNRPVSHLPTSSPLTCLPAGWRSQKIEQKWRLLMFKKLFILKKLFMSENFTRNFDKMVSKQWAVDLKRLDNVLFISTITHENFGARFCNDCKCKNLQKRIVLFWKSSNWTKLSFVFCKLFDATCRWPLEQKAKNCIWMADKMGSTWFLKFQLSHTHFQVCKVCNFAIKNEIGCRWIIVIQWQVCAENAVAFFAILKHFMPSFVSEKTWTEWKAIFQSQWTLLLGKFPLHL